MTKKVVIYTRVSTLDQTIDNQLLELRDHCSTMGWEVVKEYADEGLSGTLSRDKRPALNSLIQDAYRKRFDSVVCWDISRIGRSMKELILFLSDMKDRGIGMVPAVAMSSTRNWPRSRRADGHIRCGDR
jgi:DNA invertase Pin-like site-specific DNA recombinase